MDATENRLLALLMEAKSNGNVKEAKRIGREIDLHRRNRDQSEEMRQVIANVLSASAPALGQIDNLVKYASKDKAYTPNDAINFLEATLEDRMAIHEFIKQCDRLSGRRRSAHRHFVAANAVLEKIAATTQNPTVAMQSLINACADLREDIESNLTKKEG